MVTYAFIFIFVIICAIIAIRHIQNVNWQKKPLKNFPFIHKGKEFWYSRAVAVVHFVFAKNEDNEWCVLANKRGDGTPDYNGYWNCPCGYLDFDESGEEAAQRETFEETNIYIKKDDIKFISVNTSPKSNRQNVTLRYASVLTKPCTDYDLNSSNSEDKEVDDIAWIPLKNKDNYLWAFNHGNLIDSMVEKLNLN